MADGRCGRCDAAAGKDGLGMCWLSPCPGLCICARLQVGACVCACTYSTRQRLSDTRSLRDMLAARSLFSPSASRFFSVVVVHVWGGKTAGPVVTSNFPCLVVGCFFPTPHHPSRLALPHRTVRVHIRSCPSSLGRQAACHPLAYRLHTHLCNSRSSSERQHHHAAPSHQISISPSTYEPRFMHPSDL